MKDGELLSRREMLRLCGLSGCAALLFGGQAGAAGAERVRFGLRRGSLSCWPVEHATASGLFLEAGVHPELSYLSDELSVAHALARGEVDVGVLPTPLFYALHLGTGAFRGNASPLVTFQVALVNGSMLIVPAESPVDYSRQFKGKRIGATTMVSMPALLTEVYLLLSGLTPGQDTTWQIGPQEDLRRWFRSGSVDALASEGRLAAELLSEGTGRVMVPLSKVWRDHPADLLALRRSFHENRRSLVERIASATLRAAARLLGPDFGGLATTLPSGGISTPWKDNLEISEAGFAPFAFRSSLRIILEEMRKRGLVPSNTALGDVIDETCLSDLCRKVMKTSGFETVPDKDLREERMVACCS